MGKNDGQLDSGNETNVSPTSQEESYISTDQTNDDQPLKIDNIKSGKFCFFFCLYLLFNKCDNFEYLDKLVYGSIIIH